MSKFQKLTSRTHRCIYSHIYPSLSYPLSNYHYHNKRHHIHHPQPIQPITQNSEISNRNSELAKKCEQVTKTGVYANIGLTVIKGSAGIMTNSMALIADATHSLTDLISDFMTFATIKYSQRKPNKRFPLGFGKIDTLGTLPVAGLLCIGSYHIVKTSLSKLYLGSAATVITMPHIAMGCVILSLIVKEWLYRITLKAGEDYNSSVTIANAWHHRSDAYSSLIALIGVGGYFVGYPILDPICGMAVGIYLFKIGMHFFKLGFEQLLDRNSQIHWDIVNGIVKGCHGVYGIHDLVVTQSGQYVHINCEVMVDEKLNMMEVKEILDNVKVKLHHTETLNIQHLGVVPIPYHEHEHAHEHEHEHDNLNSNLHQHEHDVNVHVKDDSASNKLN